MSSGDKRFGVVKKADRVPLKQPDAKASQEHVYAQNRKRIQDILQMVTKEKVMNDSKQRIAEHGKGGCILSLRRGMDALCAAKGEWCTGPQDCANDFVEITKQMDKKYPGMSMTNMWSLLRTFCWKWVEFNREKLWNRFKEKTGHRTEGADN